MPFEANIQPETIARKHLAFDSVAQVVRASESSTADYRVRVSGADTQAEYLHAKFVDSMLGVLGTFQFEKTSAQGKESVRLKHIPPTVQTGHVLQGTNSGLAWGTVPGTHDAVSLGAQTNGLALSGQVLQLFPATQTAEGAMTRTDKTKLDGLRAYDHTLDHPISGVVAGFYGNVPPASAVNVPRLLIDARGHVIFATNDAIAFPVRTVFGRVGDITPSATDYAGFYSAVNHTHSEYAVVGHTHTWGQIQDKPTAFAPTAHTHAIADVVNLQNVLDGKSNTGHTHTEYATVGHLHDDRYSLLGHTHAQYALSSHSHFWSEILSRPTAVSAFTNDMGYLTSIPTHTHDDRYYTQGQSDARFAFVNHTHGQYLTAESDPTVPNHVKTISSTQISQWNTAFAWGNHAGLYAPIGHLHDDRYSQLGHLHDDRYSQIGHTHSGFASVSHTHPEYVNTSSGYGTSLIKSGNQLKSITVNGSSPLLKITEQFDTIEIAAKVDDSENWNKFYRGDGTFQTIQGLTAGNVTKNDAGSGNVNMFASQIVRSRFGDGTNFLYLNSIVEVVVAGTTYYLPAYKP